MPNLLALVIILLSTAPAPSAGDQSFCGDATYKRNGTYMSNLRTLADALIGDAARLHSATGAAGEGPDRVYGAALCRGGLRGRRLRQAPPGRPRRHRRRQHQRRRLLHAAQGRGRLLRAVPAPLLRQGLPRRLQQHAGMGRRHEPGRRAARRGRAVRRAGHGAVDSARRHRGEAAGQVGGGQSAVAVVVGGHGPGGVRAGAVHAGHAARPLPGLPRWCRRREAEEDRRRQDGWGGLRGAVHHAVRDGPAVLQRHWQQQDAVPTTK
ncbi:hypothetical protein PVAP13_2NG521203 [Panicum virgatum]|uniref:Gnk2-homologous domain-containing protein n=1 Tax=Panicum virgatum TaxID=38727 RepID=A0A8T0VUY5_PANVG|nr:hypothetical protein PVAP13_2NG521203 [Panicum virgatum]